MVERRHTLIAALSLAAWLASACTTLPAGAPAAPGSERQALPQEPAPATGMRPVSASLLLQSREQQQHGNYGAAAATLERAIRIDPAEPAIWLELARVRYAENNWPQAEQLARKSKMLAGGANGEADKLLADALRMQGRGAELHE